ncbi:MAG TPA: zinc-binding dehydrogenase [Acidimicrobiales bacterium]|jgi:NADPH2:quinone reductase
MYAIRQHEFGPAENLRYEEVPNPDPGLGQVRVAVEAAGVHLLDTAIRQGTSGGPFPLPDLPMTPGREVAGVIESAGPDVDPTWLGRRVVAHLGWASGGYAELAVVPVESLHVLPDGMAADAAVAMIGTGRTAMGILEVAGLKADDVLLVPAAAGGLGSLFVQAGRNAGATVVGLAGGPRKVEQVAALGADVAVDYLQPDWPEQVQKALGPDVGVTVVLDGVGGDVGRATLDLFGVGGRLVMFGWSAGAVTPITTEDLLPKGLSVTWIGPRIIRRPGGLRPLETAALAEAASGRWVPLVGQHFPLASAAAAHKALESRATVGKTVLVP